MFTTCYANRNEPDLAMDLCAVFEHNHITVDIAAKERCCGMPRLELGDLETVAEYKAVNIPELKGLIDQGFDIVAPIPSCVLMFKQELPLMFPDDPDVQAVRARIFDPFEYLWLRHEAGMLRTDFTGVAGQAQLPRALPPARAEHRPQDPRRAAAGAGHQHRSDRALLWPQRHLCSEEPFPRGGSQDRSSSGAEGPGREAGSLHQRLPHGRPPDRRPGWKTWARRNIRCGCCAWPTESDRCAHWQPRT